MYGLKRFDPAATRGGVLRRRAADCHSGARSLGPVLPLSPGRAERLGFEYYRHCTFSLYAAFNPKTGEALGKTAARNTGAEFVAFLSDSLANRPRGKEIHLIADNFSAHKRQPVKDFLEAPSAGSPALHSNLLIVAQPGGAVVLQDRTRCHRPRRLHLAAGLEAKTDALPPPIQPSPQDRKVEVLRSR
jgi:hypothetical protein